MTESTSAVEQAVAARIAAAKRRTEDMRRQRAELAAARRRGLAKRHAQKLRNQASALTTDGSVSVSPTETNDRPSAGRPVKDSPSLTTVTETVTDEAVTPAVSDEGQL